MLFLSHNFIHNVHWTLNHKNLKNLGFSSPGVTPIQLLLRWVTVGRKVFTPRLKISGTRFKHS